MNVTKARLVDVSAGCSNAEGSLPQGSRRSSAEAQAPFSSLYHHFPGGKRNSLRLRSVPRECRTRRSSKKCGTGRTT